MFIDTTLRNRWSLPTKPSVMDAEEEFVEDNLTEASSRSNLGLNSRFRVTAQEWLPTWRIIEN